MIFRISKTVAVPDNDPSLARKLARAVAQGFDVQVLVDNKRIWRQVEQEIKSK
jgi:hypothetical protein